MCIEYQRFITLYNQKQLFEDVLRRCSSKVSVFRVFSGPYFLAFGLNTEIYYSSLHIQLKYWLFSHSAYLWIYALFYAYSYENAFILSQLFDAHEPMWIGFTNKMRQRSFLWTDQSSVDYTNWYSRRPWWRRFFNRRDCVQFKPEYRYRGGWVDSNCNVEAGFICQKRKNYWYCLGNRCFYTY